MAAGVAAGTAATGTGAVLTGSTDASGLTFASALSQSLAATGTASTGAGSAGGLVTAVTSGSVGSSLGSMGRIGGISGVSAGTGTQGLRNAAGVPLALAGYGNGKIPATALAKIGQDSHKMWAPAAQAYQQLRAAAARDGVTIKATDSYRSYEQQVDLAQRKGLYAQGGLAAKPGTSEHGWGLSLDLDLNTKALTWMRTHAKEYGFSENVPREPWHWTFTA